MTTRKVSKKAPKFSGLQGAPLVMVWRRVSDLRRTNRLAKSAIEWPRVGGNEYADVYDAGGVLVGYWVQDEQAIAAGGSCSNLNFVNFQLAVNPATEFLLAPAQMEESVERLNRVAKFSAGPVTTPTGSTLSFVDEDGNYTSFTRPAGEALKGRAGARLKALTARGGGAGAESAEPDISNRFLGYSLTVSNLKESQKFYKDVLGLKQLKSGRSEATFDVGTAILTLKQETTLGLLRSLNRSGRLLGDWFMFHVRDVRTAVREFKRRGVKFPKGIEESPHGLGAYFNDPDGHSLSLWQPPNEPAQIDYFPQLNRILSAAS